MGRARGRGRNVKKFSIFYCGPPAKEKNRVRASVATSYLWRLAACGRVVMENKAQPSCYGQNRQRTSVDYVWYRCYLVSREKIGV